MYAYACRYGYGYGMVPDVLSYRAGPAGMHTRDEGMASPAGAYGDVLRMVMSDIARARVRVRVTVLLQVCIQAIALTVVVHKECLCHDA